MCTRCPQRPLGSVGKLSKQLSSYLDRQLEEGLRFSLLSYWLRPQAGGLKTEQAKGT